MSTRMFDPAGDGVLARAAELYFGGRRRALHILRCDRCGHDDQGDFRPCPACPANVPDHPAARRAGQDARPI